MLALSGASAFGPTGFPELAFAQRTVTKTVEKRCSRCGRSVALSSHPGQRCPYCGAYWSYEKKHWIRGTRSEPARTHATVRYHNQTFTIQVIESEGSLLVPIRTFEKLSATVKWAAGVSTVSKGNHSIRVTAEQKAVTVVLDSQPRTVEWSPAPSERGGAVYVPLRCAAEALGFAVDLDGETVVLTDTGPASS
jgi:ribosomal protein S27AE